jgi:hypothetical protein
MEPFLFASRHVTITVILTDHIYASERGDASNAPLVWRVGVGLAVCKEKPQLAVVLQNGKRRSYLLRSGRRRHRRSITRRVVHDPAAS